MSTKTSENTTSAVNEWWQRSKSEEPPEYVITSLDDGTFVCRLTVASRFVDGPVTNTTRDAKKKAAALWLETWSKFAEPARVLAPNPITLPLPMALSTDIKLQVYLDLENRPRDYEPLLQFATRHASVVRMKAYVAAKWPALENMDDTELCVIDSGMVNAAHVYIIVDVAQNIRSYPSCHHVVISGDSDGIFYALRDVLRNASFSHMLRFNEKTLIQWL